MGRLTAGRGLCAPRVISNVPGCRDSTLMERVALTPAFARQARRSSGVARHSGVPPSTGANGSCRRFRRRFEKSRAPMIPAGITESSISAEITHYRVLTSDSERAFTIFKAACVRLADDAYVQS